MKRWIKTVIAVLSTGLILFLLLPMLYPRQQDVRPQKRDISRSVYGLGSVESSDEFNLRFGVSANLTRLYVEEGDYVKKGDLLVARDTSLTFSAPFDGVVSSVYYKEDELVPAGQTVLTVTGLASMHITLSLNQNSVIHVKKGQKALVSFESLRGEEFVGTVASIYPSDGDFMVKLKITDLPSSIMPGMSCDIAIETGVRKDVLLIPAHSVQDGIVMVKRDGRTIKNKVSIQPVNSSYVEVVEGDILLSDTILLKPERGRQ